MTDTDHGSARGYSSCRLRIEGPCGRCKRARSEYMREWRRGERVIPKPSGVTLEGARGRAARRLARMFPDVMARLVAEELAKARAEVAS